MITLAPGITHHDLGIANVYLVKGRNALTLIDTGAQRSPTRLEALLRQQRLGWKDITHVIGTHAHYDHVGGLSQVQAASGAEVWMHTLDAEPVREGREAKRPDPAMLTPVQRLVGRLLRGDVRAAPVHREVYGGEHVDEVRPGAQIVHLPGHSPGMIGVWFPDLRVLLGGDVVTHFVPGRLGRPLAAYTLDMPRAKDSVRRAEALGIRTLGVGHGAPLIGNAAERLKALLRSW